METEDQYIFEGSLREQAKDLQKQVSYNYI